MFFKKKSLRAKAILMVSLFLLATNLALGAVLIRQARSYTRTQIDERMLDVVKTAAAMLDGDTLERLTPADAGTPEYRKVLDTLTVFADNVKSATNMWRVFVHPERRRVLLQPALVNDADHGGERHGLLLIVGHIYKSNTARRDL